jgi:hypothetical protein
VVVVTEESISFRSGSVPVISEYYEGLIIPIYNIGLGSASFLSVISWWEEKIIQKKSIIICFIINYPYLCTRF